MLALLTTIGGLVSAAVTAIATIFLWRVTKIMAEETKRMAEAASRPHVIASIDVNQWSTMYANITLENVGTGPAYEIEVSFDPAIPFETHGGDNNPPLSRVSLLKPGQALTSYLGGIQAVIDMEVTVTTSWRSAPDSSSREAISYVLDMRPLRAVSQLGAANPMVQIAETIKKMREDWEQVARAHRRLKVDVFDSRDRAREQRDIERRHRQIRARQEAGRPDT